MARRLRDKKTGAIVAVEFDASEMAQVLNVEPADLEQWTRLIPAAGRRAGQTIYRASREELELYKKRASVLRSRMSEAAVEAVEAAGLLDAYAALGDDPGRPEGVTAHIWRSYGLIVLMQTRYGKMIGAQELAERAGLTERDPQTGDMRPSVDTAEKHIRILRATGALTESADGRWEHQGLPRAWRGG